jgi:hypothetical protein
MTQLGLSTYITITAIAISSGNFDSKKYPLLAIIIPYHSIQFNIMVNIAGSLCAKNKNGV